MHAHPARESRSATETVPQALRREVGLDTPPALDTWQNPGFVRWSFRHIEETVPSALVSRVPERQRWASVGLDAVSGVQDLVSRLEQTSTDALLVQRGREIVAEYYAPGFGPERTHLLMSVSKSLCAIVVATFIDEGRLDPGMPIAEYVPALAGSAFGDATLRQALDMLVAVDYSEAYVDPSSEVQTHDRAAQWRTPRDGDPADVYEFLAGLSRSRGHGEQFQYCSAVTDVLAWVVENVTGRRYADVLSDRLWSRIGAERDARIGVDRGGFALANGGISCTARDLARVGRLMLDGGVAASGERIVSAEWVNETLAGGDIAMTETSPKRAVWPRFSYRNQWWSVGDDRGSVHAVGIHGQYVWLDPSTDTVIVKFSSEDLPTDLESTRRHAALFADLIAAIR